MASGFWGVNSFFLVLEVLLTLGVIFTGRKDGNGCGRALARPHCWKGFVHTSHCCRPAIRT